MTYYVSDVTLSHTVSLHRPTRSPSQSPTRHPTANPTAAPSISFCVPIRIDLIGFAEFNSDDLADDVSLQEEIASITQFAIAQTAQNHEIESDSFYVRYDDSCALIQYIDGELHQSLFINQSVCTFGDDDLQSMTLILQYESHLIAETLADLLEEFYLNGNDTDSMDVEEDISDPLEVLVDVLTELSCY